MQLSSVGKYQIRAAIGRGAVGIVYNGWDTVLVRDVAIKVLPLDGMSEEDQDKRLRFLREAQAAAGLYHPNIVGVYDYGETEDMAYIVMELLHGEPLDVLLQTRGRLPLAEVSLIMTGLLAGLQHSHSRGVVHRDIKPSNVILTRDKVVKITDFGIAHLESSDMTRVGSVMGTPAYMSPEQVLGEHVDNRADLYSAGVMLYQMLLGHRPFEGGTASVMHRIVNAEPIIPAEPSGEMPAGIAPILMKALSKRPDDRYRSAAEFNDILQRHLVTWASSSAAMHAADETVTAAPAVVLPEEGTVVAAGAASTRTDPGQVIRHRRSGRATGFALCGVAILAGAGGYGWWHINRQGSIQALDRMAVRQPGAPGADFFPTGSPSPARPADPSLIAPGLAAALDDAGQTVPCTLLMAEIGQDGRLNLQGLTALGGAAELQIRSSINRVAGQVSPNAITPWTLQRVDGPYCSVLDVLRGAPRSGAAASVLLTPAAAGVTKIGISGLPVEATLSVDFFTPDHSVTHLTSGTRLTPANFPLALPGGPGVAVVIASQAILVELNRPTQESASGYLDELRADFARARSEDHLVTIEAVRVGGTNP